MFFHGDVAKLTLPGQTCDCTWLRGFFRVDSDVNLSDEADVICGYGESLWIMSGSDNPLHNLLDVQQSTQRSLLVPLTPLDGYPSLSVCRVIFEVSKRQKNKTNSSYVYADCWLAEKLVWTGKRLKMLFTTKRKKCGKTPPISSDRRCSGKFLLERNS